MNCRLLVVLLALAPSAQLAFGQGCVCQRQNPAGYAGQNAYLARGDWLLSMGYQNYTSDRHYQGTTYVPALTSRGPTNVQNAFNLDATYGLRDRVELGLDVPFTVTSYTLNRTPPGGTQPVKDAAYAHGLGDMSLRASYWLRSTYQAKRNVALSLGIQAPTGAAGVHDTVYGRNVPVDVSVQPGSKAWAPSLGARGFWEFDHFAVFGSGIYLFNPRGTTGVPTFFGSLSNPNNKVKNSSTDQYVAQWGVVAKTWRGKWRRTLAAANAVLPD